MDGSKHIKVEIQMWNCQMGFDVVTSVAQNKHDELSSESTTSCVSLTRMQKKEQKKTKKYKITLL